MWIWWLIDQMAAPNVLFVAQCIQIWDLPECTLFVSTWFLNGFNARFAMMLSSIGWIFAIILLGGTK
jgi:hypothetical protein